MSGKWKIEELKVGGMYEATFWANPAEGSAFRFRSTHLDGKRAPKVVLCNDVAGQPGVPCRVKIKAVTKTELDGRGTIEVSFVEVLPFRLEGVWLDPVVSKKIQVLLESGLNILLDGPQGCGKTVVARAIAKSLGMRFVFFNCGAVVEATDFLASVQVRASATGQPITDFVKTDFLRALEDARQDSAERFLVFLDELNRCPEGARNALMPALDSTRKIFDPISNSFLAIPDNVQFVAATNRGSEFSGTFGIDAAQLDRFAPIQMRYPPVEEEVKLLLARHPELSKPLVEKVVFIADKVRKAPEVTHGLSVRATDEACVYLKHPLFEAEAHQVLGEILKSSFCGRFPGRFDDVGTDAGAVWAIVEAQLDGVG
jgi:MoxR-like ATPase